MRARAISPRAHAYNKNEQNRLFCKVYFAKFKKNYILLKKICTYQKKAVP